MKKSDKDEDLMTSAVDYEATFFTDAGRLEAAIAAARARGEDLARVELWRAFCPGGLTKHELEAQFRDAHLAAARRFAALAAHGGVFTAI
jgi:hypothetical protein